MRHHKQLSWRNKVPQFFNQKFGDYLVKVGAGDRIRKRIKRVLRRDYYPYLNGSYLIIECVVIPPKSNDIVTELKYESVLVGITDNKTYSHKTGIIKVLPHTDTKVKLVTDLVLRSIEYKLDIRMSKDNLDTEAYKTIATLTVQDRDEFYSQTVIPAVKDFIFLIIGAVLGVIGTLALTIWS